MTEELMLFQYQALSSKNAIRILILEPGSRNDIVRCSIKDLLISEAEGQYEGISYVWGREGHTTRIICDGKVLQVTINLNDALRRFRLPNRPRPVWADAVCINQQDQTEKNDQVRRMWKIFQQAKRVLCWPGRDDERIAEDCFNSIQIATQVLEKQWQDCWGLNNLIYDLKLPGPFTRTEGWQNIQRLLDLAWFERLWVVQECGLARECWVFWGEGQLQIHEVLEVAAWFAYSIHAPRLTDGTRVGQLFTDVFANIMCTFQRQSTWRDKTAVAKVMDDFHPAEKQLYVDLLYCARSLKATDQRDVIYSSLGSPLAYYENNEVMMAPDYNEWLSCLQIRAAQALIRSSREAPHVLLRVIHDSNEELENGIIPTWAPRCKTFNNSSARPIPLTCSYEYRQIPYRASRSSAPFTPTFRSDNILSVTGLIFDTLTWTSVWLKSGELRSDINHWDSQIRDSKISVIEAIWLQLLEHSPEPPGELIATFSLTLARGRPKSKDHLSNFLAYCEALRTIAGTTTKSPFPDHDPSKGNTSDAEWTIARARDRRIAYTAQGRLALVPVVAELGDVCCVVQGMDVPVVLRQTPQGTYKFIGESYIHGAMEGAGVMTGEKPFKTGTVAMFSVGSDLSLARDLAYIVASPPPSILSVCNSSIIF